MGARVLAWRTAVPAVVGVAVLAVAAELAAHQPAPVPAPVSTVGLTGADTSAPGVAAAAGGGEVPWWLLVTALALLLVGGAVLWFVFRDGAAMLGGRREAEELRMREGEADRRTDALAALAATALTDASAELDSGGDPREVVIACWVRIEHAAEELGQGRRPAETATDVARRWLAGSPDRRAVDDLAALYHLARYSTHPLTDDHRERARSALRGVVGARVSAQHTVVHHDRGPRVAVALLGAVGLVALGLGAAFLGVALVLLALAGGVATAVGPVLTRRTAQLNDIVVPRWTGADAQALATEQRRLSRQLGDAEQLDAVVRPRLRALVDDRLARRGVEPGSPAAAALLGEPLTAFLTGGGRRTLSPAAFGTLLDRVETL